MRISDLYETLGDEEGEPDDGCLLDEIVKFDCAEILDEYIRRTGAGITSNFTSADDQPEAVLADKRPLYLGLTVHGKKRKDLARKNDPNVVHHHDTAAIPLLWKAVQANAKSVVEYLCGDRPHAAYRFYYNTHNDELAERLRAVPDFGKVLPEWLGWKKSVTNDSPLSAAILGKNLELVKILFSKSPGFMASLLHERYVDSGPSVRCSSLMIPLRIKFLGHNALMIAVEVGADSNLVDYLLAKGVSPVETDQLRGSVVLHCVPRL